MEKIQTTLVETRMIHRDEPCGLFIGTSMHLLALMNSAPAELLHPLPTAALQPYFACASTYSNRTTRSGAAARRIQATTTLEHSTLSGSTVLPYASAKKNASVQASVGILFQYRQRMFQKKRRLTRIIRIQRR
jgi:hypothetical protein